MKKIIITSLKIISALLVCGLLLIFILFRVNWSGCAGGMPSETSRFVDSVKYNDEIYYLYARTTGFQEKIIYFELYEAKPEFDACNRSDQNLLYTIHYDDYPNYPDRSITQYVKSLSLDLDDPEKLKIVYTKNHEEGFLGPHSVKFSLLPKP